LTGGGPPPAGNYYWEATNVQGANKNSGGAYEPLVADNNNNQWGDLKLSVTREETRLYSTVNINGDPTVDGNINDDLAWTDAYKRDMTFTNFEGSIIDVRFYSVQNQVTNNIWCGFWVEDDDFNGADEFHIFQEREAVAASTGRDYLLDDNFENQIKTDVTGAAFGDWEYDLDSWNVDETDQEGQAAVQYFPTPTPHYEFEFELPYIAGTEDVNMINDNQLFGFYMKFVDSDMGADNEFFWEFTANDELIRIEETDQTHIAVGWVDLQMGGPAITPVTPDDGGVVFGKDYIFRIWAQDEEVVEPYGIQFAAFKTDNMDTFKKLFHENEGFWFTHWDTTGEPNGPTTVTIVATDNDGITVYLQIDIIIANPGPDGDPPLLVQITGPPAPGPHSGTINIDATAVFADYIEFHIDGMLFAVDDTVPFGASLDTTLFNDGGHIISIRAVNIAGATWDSEVYEFDNWDLNSLSITNPTDGSPQTGPISVDATFTAADSVNYAELYVDEVFWSFTDNTVGGTVSFQLDTNLLTEGAHQLKIFVYDPDGNKLMDMVSIFVDNVPPDVPAVVGIIDDQFIHGMFTFQVECDIEDIKAVDITVTDEDLMTAVISGQNMGYNSASGYYELGLDTRALVDGNYSVFAESMDYAGNTEMSSTMTFKVDNNPPKLMVSSPMDNAMVSGDVDIMAMAMDPFLMGVMYKIDGNSWMDINMTWDTTAYHDGAHMIHIMAADYLGHESMVTLNVVVDNNGPTVDIINPLSMEFVMGVFTFRVAATDMVGVDMVEISLENTDTTTMILEDQAIPFNSVTGHYEYTLDTVSIDDGHYTFSAMSYDISGQASAVDSVDFMIDNNAPELVITSPLSGDMVPAGVVPINADATDVFLLDAMYSVDGGAWVDLATPWDTTLIRDGMHTIDFLVTDEAGHMTTRTIMVSSDNTGPSIYVVYAPANGTRVGSTFMIQVEVVDIHEIDMVSYDFGESGPIRMFKNMDTGFYESTVFTESLSNEQHTLDITAVDINEQSTTITRSLIVDNEGPSIDLLSPSGKTVEGDVEFSLDVTDLAGVEHVYISINKGPWLEMRMDASEDYVYHWNSDTVYNGKYDVDFKAEDSLGNEATHSIVITVDNFPMLGFLIFLIVLIILVVLMIASWPRGGKKKKKSKAPKEDFVMDEPEEPEPDIPEPETEEVLDLGEIEEKPEMEMKSSDEFMDTKEDNL
jgi:hypothetical protein